MVLDRVMSQPRLHVLLVDPDSAAAARLRHAIGSVEHDACHGDRTSVRRAPRAGDAGRHVRGHRARAARSLRARRRAGAARRAAGAPGHRRDRRGIGGPGRRRHEARRGGLHPQARRDRPRVAGRRARGGGARGAVGSGRRVRRRDERPAAPPRSRFRRHHRPPASGPGPGRAGGEKPAARSARGRHRHREGAAGASDPCRRPARPSAVSHPELRHSARACWRASCSDICGAFTGAERDRACLSATPAGTVFLDEIAEAPPRCR